MTLLLSAEFQLSFLFVLTELNTYPVLSQNKNGFSHFFLLFTPRVVKVLRMRRTAPELSFHGHLFSVFIKLLAKKKKKNSQCAFTSPVCPCVTEHLLVDFRFL